MEKKFKIGDTVQLKSGGPHMTVAKYEVDIFTNSFDGIVVCTWFVQSDKKSATFNQDSLEKV